MKRICVAIAVCVAALLAQTVARAKTIEVPKQFATIQAAVDAAQPGDKVHVHAGIYLGSVTVMETFGVSIVGDHGAVLIGSMIPAQPGIDLASPGNSVSGLTIENFVFGVAIVASSHVDHCTITGCGIGIYASVSGDGGLPAPSQIDHNMVSGCGNGIELDNCENASVDHNAVSLNGLVDGADPVDASGILVEFSDTCVVSQNAVNGNGAGIYAFFSFGCTFDHNTALGNGYFDVGETVPGANNWSHNTFAPDNTLGI